MPPKSKKKKTSKSAARRLLTKFINEIAEEKHCDPEIIDGEAIIVTKAEKLARFIWKSALGYTETINIVNKGTGEIVKRTQYVEADKTYVNILYDRMEGKVAPVEPEKADGKPTAADKVSEQTKSRLNKMAKK